MLQDETGKELVLSGLPVCKKCVVMVWEKSCLLSFHKQYSNVLQARKSLLTNKLRNNFLEQKTAFLELLWDPDSATGTITQASESG